MDLYSAFRYEDTEALTTATYCFTDHCDVTLKVHQVHWQWHNSVGHIQFLLVICSNDVSTSNNEIWINGHARLLKMTLFERTCMTSYQFVFLSISEICDIQDYYDFEMSGRSLTPDVNLYTINTSLKSTPSTFFTTDIFICFYTASPIKS